MVSDVAAAPSPPAIDHSDYTIRAYAILITVMFVPVVMGSWGLLVSYDYVPAELGVSGFIRKLHDFVTKKAFVPDEVKELLRTAPAAFAAIIEGARLSKNSTRSLWSKPLVVFVYAIVFLGCAIGWTNASLLDPDDGRQAFSIGSDYSSGGSTVSWLKQLNEYFVSTSTIHVLTMLGLRTMARND